MNGAGLRSNSQKLDLVSQCANGMFKIADCGLLASEGFRMPPGKLGLKVVDL